MRKRPLFALISLLALAIAATGSVAAQDATPASTATTLTAYNFSAPFAPAADLCTIAPVSTDEAANLLATPTPLFEPPLNANGTVALPGGVPADDAATAGVLAALTQLWACNNAGNPASMYAVFSPSGLQQMLGVTSDSTLSLEEIRAKVAAGLTPSEPRPADELASIDAVVSVLAQPDGSIGVLVLNSDPRVADGDQVLDYFAFTTTDGTNYQLSTVILDPFDLSSGYGYDKA